MVSKYRRHSPHSVKNKLKIFTPAEGRIFGIWGLSDRFRCKIGALGRGIEGVLSNDAGQGETVAVSDEAQPSGSLRPGAQARALPEVED